MTYDIDTSRSYSTEANLLKGLEKLGFHRNRYLVVRNRAGRFTAIFPASECQGLLGLFANEGFMTIG